MSAMADSHGSTRKTPTTTFLVSTVINFACRETFVKNKTTIVIIIIFGWNGNYTNLLGSYRVGGHFREGLSFRYVHVSPDIHETKPLHVYSSRNSNYSNLLGKYRTFV